MGGTRGTVAHQDRGSQGTRSSGGTGGAQPCGPGGHRACQGGRSLQGGRAGPSWSPRSWRSSRVPSCPPSIRPGQIKERASMYIEDTTMGSAHQYVSNM
jgi:hypothetical protein